jgi:hypothetical protein
MTAVANRLKINYIDDRDLPSIPILVAVSCDGLTQF